MNAIHGIQGILGCLFILLAVMLVKVKATVIAGAASEQLNDGYAYAYAQSSVAVYDVFSTMSFGLGLLICLYAIAKIANNLYERRSKSPTPPM